MWREKEIVIIGLMLVLFVLALQNSRVTITGNAVAEGSAAQGAEAQQTAAAANAMGGMAGNVEAIKNIIAEEQKKDAFCENECAPEGRTCEASILSECADVNFDGCLEFRKTQCINGCDGNACKQEPRPIKKSQSQVIKERSSIITDGTCAGKIIGTVQWNPHGSLCRKAEETTRSGGLFKPLDCCSKFYYDAACTQNLGMIRRGLMEYSQFFVIGCYEP